MMSCYFQPNFRVFDDCDDNAFLKVTPKKRQTSSSILKLSETFCNGPVKKTAKVEKLKNLKACKPKTAEVVTPKTQAVQKLKPRQTKTKKKESSMRKSSKQEKAARKSKKIDSSKRQIRRKVSFGLDESIHRASREEKYIAAVKIQRIARGGWQRLKFRIAVLQHKLNTSKDSKRKEVRAIQESLQQRKYIFREKLERKVTATVTAESKSTTEHKQLIAYLQKDNKKLREKNKRLFGDIQLLKYENERLEEANKRTDGYMLTLKEHLKELGETNAKLMKVVPMYRESVERTEEALARRQEFGVSEQKIKLMYTRCVGNLVEMLEENCDEDDLFEEVFDLCLDLEDLDKAAAKLW